MNEGRTALNVLKAKVDGAIERDRPKKRWTEGIRKLTLWKTKAELS